MPRAVFSFTNSNPFYYKQSSAVKTIAAKFKQWLRASTYCLSDRSTALTLLRWHTKLLYESFGAVVEDLQAIVSIFSNYITCGSWEIGWLTFACS